MANFDYCEKCGKVIFPGQGYVVTDNEGDRYTYHKVCKAVEEANTMRLVGSFEVPGDDEDIDF